MTQLAERLQEQAAECMSHYNNPLAVGRVRAKQPLTILKDGDWLDMAAELLTLANDAKGRPKAE